MSISCYSGAFAHITAEVFPVVIDWRCYVCMNVLKSSSTSTNGLVDCCFYGEELTFNQNIISLVILHIILHTFAILWTSISKFDKCFIYSSSFRHSKDITSHWEPCTEQLVANLSPFICLRHSGTVNLHSGCDQQPGDAAGQPTLPVQLWVLQPRGLPGSLPRHAGCDYTDCHSYATGQTHSWSSLLPIFDAAVSKPVMTFSIVSLVNLLSRYAGMDCCCYREHLRMFVCLILNRGLWVFLECGLCTTFTSGSWLIHWRWPLCMCNAMLGFQYTGEAAKFDFCTGAGWYTHKY